MNDNYHTAMNAPIQHNSDGSDQGIEMYESLFYLVQDYLVAAIWVCVGLAVFGFTVALTSFALSSLGLP